MTKTMTVLVTGASGTLGAAVLPRLAAEGYDVRPTSRHARPGWWVADLASGAGVAESVRGVDTVVHLASGSGKNRDTDIEGTRRLVAAAHEAGVRHLLYVSIVGIERVPISYYRTKLAAEERVRAGAVPWTILRATQFPQLVDQLLTVSSKLGVLIEDRSLLVQPVHVEDVAGRIADLLAAEPSGAVEFGGPEALRFEELARQWQRARGSKRPVLPIRVPGRAGRELRAGALTTAAEPAGTHTWADYLAATY
jgi:uncharacterized protein YbjT (DUF2867 family)